MFGIGQKRNRVPRSVALRRPRTVWTRLYDLYQNRSLQVRLGVVFVAAMLLVAALQSWRAPFAFRLGDYVPHGISSKIQFERVDREETARARDRAEEGVALIFRNNPTPLQSLPAELRAGLGDIAQADAINKLSSETIDDFGLHNIVPQTEKAREAAERYGAKSPEDRFQKLRAAIVGPDQSMAQERIDRMVEEFAQFIDPLFDIGIIDPKDLRQGITESKSILVVDENQPDKTGRDALLPQVRLQDQLNEAGQLGRSWSKYPSLTKEIQPALSYWLFRRAQPTLRYDQAATKAAIMKTRD
ncbi:MAG TPA: hypothetical protein VNQ76_12345, partial [Planctomicrobium sp.]|nr:hypothetical protein [Planctomicrobium sp.]